VTAAPGQAAADGLEPGVGGDGQHQDLAQGMEDCANPALTEPVGHGEAEGKNNRDLDPENRVTREKGQKEEGAEKDHALKKLKTDKGKNAAIEGRIKIFGKSIPKIAEVVVHPATDQGDVVAGIGTITIQNTKSGRPHLATQGDIFHQMAGDRPMTSNGLVGCPAKEKELAVGGAEGWGPAAHPVWQIEENEKMHKGDDETFAPAFGLEVGPKGKQIGPFPDGKVDRLGKGDVREPGVGIDKNEEFTLGLLSQLMAGPGLTGPSRWEIFPADQANPRIPLGPLPDDFGRAVGGVVIKDKDFKIGIVAVNQGAQAGSDSLLLVSGGNENGDAGRGLKGRECPGEAESL